MAKYKFSPKNTAAKFAGPDGTTIGAGDTVECDEAFAAGVNVRWADVNAGPSLVPVRRGRKPKGKPVLKDEG